MSSRGLQQRGAAGGGGAGWGRTDLRAAGGVSGARAADKGCGQRAVRRGGLARRRRPALLRVSAPLLHAPRPALIARKGPGERRAPRGCGRAGARRRLRVSPLRLQRPQRQRAEQLDAPAARNARAGATPPGRRGRALAAARSDALERRE